jgi:hypothetical protein
MNIRRVHSKRPEGVPGVVPGGTSELRNTPGKPSQRNFKKVVLRSGVFLGPEVPPGTTPGTPSGTLTVNPPIHH